MKTKVTLEIVFDTELPPNEAWAEIEGWAMEHAFEMEHPDSPIENIIVQVTKIDQSSRPT